MLDYLALYFESSKANIPMNIGFKNHNPAQNHPDFPKFFATLKKDTIYATQNTGSINNDKTHHPDIPAILNRK